MIAARLGPYEIVARLGAGGMGEVYRARDTRLGRDVAIKVLPPELAEDPGRLHRFEQEAKATAALAHPNVLALYDVGTYEGKPYLVEELLEGQTLRARLRAGPLGARKATEIAIAIAHGLAAAHAKGIVHRDLKPENVFLTKDGGVKILDFGLAKLAGPMTAAELAAASTVDRETRSGAVLGTLGYLSPEQARGHAVDARSDLFALGCLLHEMLGGERPFHGETAIDLVTSLLRDDPPPLPPEVPAPLRQLVLRCLEKQPEERPDSAFDVALWLAGLGVGDDVPSPSRPRARRWLARRPLAFGALALAAVSAWLVLRALLGELNDAAGAPRAGPIRSIAVLPLTNLSGDPAEDYLADAMTEALIVELARFSGFEKVISRTSVMGYRQSRKPLPVISRELDVESLLEGTVQRVGSRVRVSVQLIDARTDSHRWAESFDREMVDVLILQSEIAKSVADALQASLVATKEPNSKTGVRIEPAVYEAYARGIAPIGTMDEPSLRRSIAALEEVTARDASFAPAWFMLFARYRTLTYQTRQDPGVAWDRARAAGERFLALEPDSVEGNIVRGGLAVGRWEWSRAETEYRSAVRREPANARSVDSLAHHLVMVRRFDEGLPLADQAIALDPINPARRRVKIWYLASAGYFERALAEGERLLPSLPDDPGIRGWLASAALGAGRTQEAVLYARQIAALVAGNESPYYLCKLTWVYGLAGEPGRAKESYEELAALSRATEVQPMFLAIARIGIGDHDGAIGELERGVDEHDRGMVYLNSNPELNPLRSDPRFQVLLCRMRFPGTCPGEN